MTAANVWDELHPSVLADQIANEQRQIVRDFESSRPRSQQQVIGPSGIGSPCSRCLAREILGVPLDRGFDDPWFKVIGSATHTWLEEARVHRNKQLNRGRYVISARVHPDGEDSDVLPKGGDLDFYDADTFTVVDDKVVGLPKIKKVKANGPGDQYRRQVHLYGAGLIRQGYRVDNVAIAFWNRNGFLHDLHVWTEPYDEAVAVEALDRFRTIRALALSLGVAVLPELPADPDCWSCKGAAV
jgi:hypothetical protein